jgi:translation initiation factor 2B subunit (eIF-2B alpha/beta/delta family)
LGAFGDDRTSGSTDVAAGFLDELARRVATDASPTPAELRGSLLGWLRAAQAAQPSMALVHQLAARALAVVDAAVARDDPVAEARRSLEASCAAERADLEAATAALARQALALLAPGGGEWIATLSSSAAIREALRLAQAEGRAPRVLLGEGRPRLEGREQAAALAAEGLPAWLVVDAALPLVLSQARQLWLGADAVTELGVLNKVGSYGAALAAREHSVPVYALASRRKFLPANTGALRIVEMPPGEVWESPPPGVRPRNVYFELVPLPLFRGVVVEDAVLSPGEAAQLARECPLPSELAGG